MQVHARLQLREPRLHGFILRGVERALRVEQGEQRVGTSAVAGFSQGRGATGLLQFLGLSVGLCLAAVDRVQRNLDVAEARLAAADADVAAARAAMLPRVTLGGSLGYAGDRVRTLFDNPLYSLAAGLAAPVFDAGRLAAEAGQASARRTELLANYHQAIVAAFGDVEVALNAVDGSRAQAEAQAVELLQAGRAAALAESRYRAGAETLLTLLDAQRTLYAAQDEAVQARLARLQAGVALHRALGGGWQVAEVSR